METWQIKNAKVYKDLTKHDLKGLKIAIEALERNLNYEEPSKDDCDWWVKTALKWTDNIQKNLENLRTIILED